MFTAAGSQVRFENKNALAYYNAGVVHMLFQI
jgi:hypothetical protein